MEASNQFPIMISLAMLVRELILSHPYVILRGLTFVILIIKLITSLRIKRLINVNSVLQQMHTFVSFECEAISLQDWVSNLLEYSRNICFIYPEFFSALAFYNLLTSDQINRVYSISHEFYTLMTLRTW